MNNQQFNTIGAIGELVTSTHHSLGLGFGHFIWILESWSLGDLELEKKFLNPYKLQQKK